MLAVENNGSTSPWNNSQPKSRSNRISLVGSSSANILSSVPYTATTPLPEYSPCSPASTASTTLLATPEWSTSQSCRTYLDKFRHFSSLSSSPKSTLPKRSASLPSIDSAFHLTKSDVHSKSLSRYFTARRKSYGPGVNPMMNSLISTKKTCRRGSVYDPIANKKVRLEAKDDFYVSFPSFDDSDDEKDVHELRS